MLDPEPHRAARGQLAALGLLGILATFALAGFGLWSLRHDEVLVLHEAQQAARGQVVRLQRVIEQALREPPLPSAADVDAFRLSMGEVSREPLTRVEAVAPGTLALLVRPAGTYPDLTERPEFVPHLEATLRDDSTRKLWQRAEALQAVVGNREEALALWQRILDSASGTEWEQAARFRVGRSLLQLGRTAHARPLLEQVSAAASTSAGETGLPLDILALRALLQIAEVDNQAAGQRNVWIDGLCQRALLRSRLPASLVDEWDSAHHERISAWKRTATLHAGSRTFFSVLAERRNGALTNATPRWIESGGAEFILFTSHEAAGGGRWLLARPEAALRVLLEDTLAAHALPPYTAAGVYVAGRRLVDPPPGAAELASSTDDFTGVALHLARPGALLAQQRVRTRVFAGFIALAAITVVAGFISAVRAFERQRQFAAMQSDFVASVSHELRAPLAAVRLMAEELSDLPETQVSRRAQYNRLILRETQRLGLLIENVLRYARLERSRQAPEREHVDIREVARSSAEGLRPSAEERELQFEMRLPSHRVMVLADDQALRQVLVNLLDNAIKHSPAGATVTVGVDDALPPEASATGRARFWVADQGAGIPSADQKRIFESFYRRGTELRRETSGVGLGLAIVQRIVKAHGGTITVASQPGAGSRFIVELPLAVPDLRDRPDSHGLSE